MSFFKLYQTVVRTRYGRVVPRLRTQIFKVCEPGPRQEFCFLANFSSDSFDLDVKAVFFEDVFDLNTFLKCSTPRSRFSGAIAFP